VNYRKHHKPPKGWEIIPAESIAPLDVKLIEQGRLVDRYGQLWTNVRVLPLDPHGNRIALEELLRLHFDKKVPGCKFLACGQRAPN